MDGGGAQYNPRTVEEVFRDFKGRRAGMIKALTTDVNEFYQQCDPVGLFHGFGASANVLKLVNVLQIFNAEVPSDASLRATVGVTSGKSKRLVGVGCIDHCAVQQLWMLDIGIQIDIGWNLSFGYKYLVHVHSNTQKWQSYINWQILEKENLCLYGFPSEQWEVNLPAEEVPPELPEPALGINFARDGMQEKDWLSLVAVHSDAWLLSVAFYFGARFGFDKNDRKRLFNMINELPSIFEVVTGTAKKQVKEKTSGSNHSTNKSKPNAKVQRVGESQGKVSKSLLPKDEEEGLEEEEEEEHGETLCGACGENYASDEFWICCDICEKWFHGKCVKITPARAEHIKQYKCPSCSNKRARP
ncbi:hypothetical protein Syun_026503 [Stephania yunnanensis]|uniref:PHD finger protein ALFIN-LIKE n=1 Tax=Stephania yunnanensis TaxID=152371 RepID=A0AAP0F0R0_9MAGN